MKIYMHSVPHFSRIPYSVYHKQAVNSLYFVLPFLITDSMIMNSNMFTFSNSCVVIEDSGIGLAAAKAAGMKCIVTKSG